jgi:hypothetical protein
MDLTWTVPFCWLRVTITVSTTVGKVETGLQNSLARLWISPCRQRLRS